MVAPPWSVATHRPREPTHPVRGRSRVGPYAVAVSTRLLIILALVCGLAILVAFAVQAVQII